MLTLSSDVALAAAAEFDKLLGSFTGKGFVEQFDQKIWQALEEGGWLVIGQESGGERFRILDLVELALVWGKHLVPAPYISTVIAQRWMGTKAMPSEHGFTYSIAPGARALVPFGGLEGTTFLSSLGRDGAKAGEISVLDRDDFAPSLPLAHVATGTGSDAEISRETVILLAAEAVGFCDALLTKTVDYANFRKAYDQEIGKFQAIRHRMADIVRDIEACRGLIVTAANEPAQATGSSRLVARMARRIVENCLQTHGAIGFTWDLGIHRYLRHTIALEKLIAQYARASAPVGR
jgi:hypothetical protein